MLKDVNVEALLFRSLADIADREEENSPSPRQSRVKGAIFNNRAHPQLFQDHHDNRVNGFEPSFLPQSK